jgi:hypothetical protein
MAPRFAVSPEGGWRPEAHDDGNTAELRAGEPVNRLPCSR